MNRRTLIPIIAATLSVALLAGCAAKPAPKAAPSPAASAALASDALSAFDRIISVRKQDVGYHAELSHWGFTAPTGDLFEWSKDTAANQADLAMVLVADPLIAAGLDITKLGGGWSYKAAEVSHDAQKPAVILKTENLQDTSYGPANAAEDTASKAMERLLTKNSDRLGYHDELSHYGVAYKDGDKFEWTKALGTNDADLAFVVVAEPLIKSGLDPKKLAGGWVYQDAKTEHGKKLPALLIKPIKLK